MSDGQRTDPAWLYISPMTAGDGSERIEFDVFISHAHEDKDNFVRPLAHALAARRLRPWYDEFTLRPGDSLRRSIDYGLLTSQAGIVVQILVSSPSGGLPTSWTGWCSCTPAAPGRWPGLSVPAGSSLSGTTWIRPP